MSSKRKRDIEDGNDRSPKQRKSELKDQDLWETVRMVKKIIQLGAAV
jgi:hypothetical protein